MVEIADVTRPEPESLAAHRTTPRPTAGRMPWPLWRPLGIILISRVLAWMVLALVHPLTHARSPFTVFGWDSGWYLYAAQHGWPRAHPLGGTLVFFPALPATIRALHAVAPLTWLASGYTVALAEQGAMVIAVWLLTRDLWGQRAATRATLLLCFFPGAYVFSLIYSEPLFIAACAACLLALRHQRWWLAGAIGAVGTITRVDGVALVACCAWEAAVAIRTRRDWGSLVAVLMAPAGVVAWFAYLWAWTGSAFAWFDAEKGWHNHTSALALVDILDRTVRRGWGDLNGVVTLVTVAVAVVLLLVLVRARPPASLIIFSAIVIGLPVLSQPQGLHPRYLMAAFPLVMAAGYRLKDEAFGLVLGASAMVMSGLLVLTVSSRVLTP